MEQDPIQIAEFLCQSAADISISIPDGSIPRFCRYVSELKKWNKVINLTSIQDDREIIVKHFVDSLAGLKVIEIKKETELLDVGAGAGFPALPLKFVQPDLSVELLEPSEKKGSFLRYMIGSLGLEHTTVATIKLENYMNRPGIQRLFDYIVVRAFRLDNLGPALGQSLKEGGKVVLYRASKVERHFKLDSLALVKEVEYELPSGYGHRTLSVFSKQIK